MASGRPHRLGDSSTMYTTLRLPTYHKWYSRYITYTPLTLLISSGRGVPALFAQSWLALTMAEATNRSGDLGPTVPIPHESKDIAQGVRCTRQQAVAQSQEICEPRNLEPAPKTGLRVRCSRQRWRWPEASKPRCMAWSSLHPPPWSPRRGAEDQPPSKTSAN